jgi:hypothetical protein
MQSPFFFADAYIHFCTTVSILTTFDNQFENFKKLKPALPKFAIQDMTSGKIHIPLKT